ncbi:MAG: DUF202 domain-containing protein [Candidatus Sabulitectum sp.]|nr:DUF202 domain-containing protein [Candidatus Sabulitectum sp.]
MGVDAGNSSTAKHDSFERDRLARERTFLSNERTLLSYTRTAIMLFASGATLVKLFPSSFFYVSFGAALIGLSLFTAVLGVFRYRRMKRRISDE